jgi:hypothetical protein
MDSLAFKEPLSQREQYNFYVPVKKKKIFKNLSHASHFTMKNSEPHS